MIMYAEQELHCRSEIECAESYYADFLRAYNDQFDGVIGCPAQSPVVGFVVVSFFLFVSVLTLDFLQEKQRYINTLKQNELDSIRTCLTSSGFGGRDGGSLSFSISFSFFPSFFSSFFIVYLFFLPSLAQFIGTPCTDSRCIFGCDKDYGICSVGTREQMETMFLRCWMKEMGSFVEV